MAIIRLLLIIVLLASPAYADVTTKRWYDPDIDTPQASAPDDAVIVAWDPAANDGQGGTVHIELGDVRNPTYLPAGPPGDDGITSLIGLTTESAGENCAAGGVKIDTGLDADASGVLEPGEILTTGYVCNGIDGQDGTGAVDSVFGRTGAIVTQTGDYTPAQVGADPAGSAAAVQGNLNTHTGSTANPHSVTPAQVGLGNVDNTSDADKPVSTAQQTALDAKLNAADAGTAALLDTGLNIGDVVAVVDVGYCSDTQYTDQTTCEANTETWTPVAGLALTAVNLPTVDGYQVAGVPLTAADLGGAPATDLTNHTSSTANPHSVTSAQVGLGNVDNTSDADKPVSTAQQTALNLKFNISSAGSAAYLDYGVNVGDIVRLVACGICSDTQYKTQATCETATEIWTTNSGVCFPATFDVNQMTDSDGLLGGGSLTITETTTTPDPATLSSGDVVVASTSETVSFKTANGVLVVSGAYTQDAAANTCSGIIGTQTAYAPSTPSTGAYHEVTMFELGCSGQPVSINATVGEGEFILMVYEDNAGEPGDLLWSSSQFDETNSTAHTITANISGLNLPETTNIWLGLTASQGSTYYREDDYGTPDIGRNMADGTSTTVAPTPNDPWDTVNDSTYQRRRTVWLQF
ncbi:hypothetical protein [uncultured Desulfuromusa sp.]|uniref:DUF7151 family protein n=1 Tax=uncultured Desulfuromusa sp. TaxID=219183 RepID=UPI002AA94992|nr:hypothetical protein [uncultured Desulfuromusa sp.]